MKPSFTPPKIQIKLTKIIDYSKKPNKHKNIPCHPIPQRTMSKHVFNHLSSSQFLAGKRFSSIDHTLYKHIMTGKQPKISDQKSKPKLQQNYNTINLPQSINCQNKKYAFFKQNQPFNQTLNGFKDRNYAGRLTTKEYYRNIDFMNRTSPLEAWKQLSKSYSKTQKTNQPELTHASENNQPKKLSDKSLQLLINCHKQNLPDYLHKTEQNSQVSELINKWKERQEGKNKFKRQKRDNKEGELEENIVLRKSMSCKISFEEFQQNNYNIGSFLTEQNANGEMLGLKKQASKKYEKRGSLPTQTNDQNPIVLLHKQPLDKYMSTFFEPTQQIKSPKKRPKPLQLIRIKTKKMSTRNADCLERIKKSLFKDKTRRDLFANESPNKAAKQSDLQNDEVIDTGDRVQASSKCTQKTMQQSQRSSQRNSNHGFCKFLKKQSGKSTDPIENKNPQMQKNPSVPQQPNELKEQQTKDIKQQYGCDVQKQSLKSSRISFSEVPTPQLPRTSVKGHSLINAW